MKISYYLTVLASICIFAAALCAQDEGASVWQQIDDLNEAKDFDGAYTLLAPLETDYGSDVRYLWRMARHHFDNSDNTTDEAIIEREIYAGFGFAEQALAADSSSADANGYYGILIGRVGEIEGTKQKILNSYDVKKYTLRAINMDPEYDGWQHVMGRWHFTLADLSWFERTIASIIYAKPPKASFEEAEQYFIHAGELDPEDIRHFLWLGKTRLELDQEEAAREALETAIGLSAQSDSDTILQEEAKELLGKL